MSKLFTLASMLALVAGCKKDSAAPTVPASALPETSEDREMARSPMGTSGTARDPMITPETEEEELAQPSSEILAGGNPVPMKKESLFVDPGAATPEPVTEVVAVMAPTKGNKVRGTIRFKQVDDGLELIADLTSLPKGNHAFHVHMFGDCSSPDAESAGPHFHFHGSSTAPEEAMITGDLGELVGSKAGKVKATTTISHAALQGKYSIIGRSVVIHAGPNDQTKPPDGGAGKRLACGVIGVAHVDVPEPTAPTPTTTPTLPDPNTPTVPPPTAPTPIPPPPTPKK